jgi:hypothetical protein
MVSMINDEIDIISFFEVRQIITVEILHRKVEELRSRISTCLMSEAAGKAVTELRL